MPRLSSVERSSALPFCVWELSRLSVDPALCETEECESDDLEEKESAEAGGECSGRGINTGSTFATMSLPNCGGRVA